MDYRRVLSVLAVLLLASVSGVSALEVISVAPSPNSIGVVPASDIGIWVDESIDVGTLTDQAVQVYGSLSGRVGGTLSWDGGSQKITFAPTQEFYTGELVSCVITRELTTLGGDSLVSAYSWDFFVQTPEEELSYAPIESYDAQSPVRYVQLTDLDLDGDLDACALNYQTFGAGLTLMTNDGSGGYSYESGISFNYNAEHFVVSEFNGDGYPDFAAGCGEFLAIVLSDGAGGYSPVAYVDVSGAGYESVAGDVDLDGDQDLVCSRYSTDEVVILTNDGSGGFTPLISYLSEDSPAGVTLGDFDGDGLPDLAVAYGAAEVATVRLNNGDGTFGDPDTLATAGEAVNVIAADFDGDAVVDLAVTNIPENIVNIYTGDGAGGFTPHNWVALAHPARYLTAIDIEGDGDLDIACKAWPWARLMVMYNNGMGSFLVSTTDQYHSGYGYNAGIGDVTGDGFPDFVMTNQQALELNVVPNRWSLVAEPDSVSFDVLPDLKGSASQWVQISSNREEVSYTISDDAPWLSLDPAAGTTPDSILFTVTTAGLSVGTYTTEVVALPDDTACFPATIPVVLNVVNYSPEKAFVGHINDRIEMAISNFGVVGTFGQMANDYFSGDSVRSLIFPVDSNLLHLYGAGLWLGGVVGDDTLVSTGIDGWSVMGTEFYPDPQVPFETPVGGDTSWYETSYADTAVWIADPDYFGRPHLPLNVEISQRSVSWSLEGGEQFVLIRYAFHNIGSEQIQDMYVGLYADADIHLAGESFAGAQDDLTGFLRTVVVELAEGCSLEDTLNLAWAADNDGIHDGDTPVPHVMGTAIVDAPPSATEVSYNWWTSNGNPSLDFGPRERAFMGAWQEDFRDFGTGGTGTPEGDVNKYYQLRNREIDYNQYYLGVIGQSDPLWRQPFEQQGDWENIADALASGVDTRYLVSVGPFDLAPGQAHNVVLAMVVGANLHTVPGNITNLPDDPAAYEANLDFSDLIATVRTAKAAYDIPGVDTDQDGYAGVYVMCDQDTIWVEGDGVPDWSFEPTSCCVGMRGNADFDPGDAVNIADATYLVAYLFGGAAPPACPEEADVNGDGVINIQDVTDLIGFLFQSGEPPAPCP